MRNARVPVQTLKLPFYGSQSLVLLDARLGELTGGTDDLSPEPIRRLP